MYLYLFSFYQTEKSKVPLQTTIRSPPTNLSHFNYNENPNNDNSSVQFRFVNPAQSPPQSSQVSFIQPSSSQYNRASPTLKQTSLLESSNLNKSQPNTVVQFRSLTSPPSQPQPINVFSPIPSHPSAQIQTQVGETQSKQLPLSVSHSQSQQTNEIDRRNVGMNTEERERLVKGTQVDKDLIKKVAKSTNTDLKLDQIEQKKAKPNHFNEGFKIYFDNVRFVFI